MNWKYCKIQVEKVHPEAWLVPSAFWKLNWIVVPAKLFGFILPRWMWEVVIGSGTNFEDAWIDAFNKLKQQGKIK